MNIEKSKIYIEKRSFSDIMTFLIFILPFVFQIFIELFNFPTIIKFITDIILVIFVIIYVSKKIYVFDRSIIPFSVIIWTFAIYCFITYIFNYESPFYLLWGTRNYFRFYVAFFFFVTMLTEQKAYKYLDILDKLFWVNSVVCVVQIFLGYRQDFLGGLFGVEKGCNGATFIFFTIVIAKSLLQFMSEKESLALCLSKTAVALVISAFAELKIFYFVFIIIVVIATIVTSFSWKKIIFLLVSGFLVSVTTTLLVLMFDTFQGFLSWDSLIMQLTLENYASNEDIGRFSALSLLSEKFLQTVPQQFFGLGLGNCDTSSLEIFATKFYDLYQESHYSYFSHAYLFLETGLIGLLIYCSFFIASLVQSVKLLRNGKGDKFFCQLSIITSVLCFILLLYNSSLRTDIAYLVYFTLALPYVNRDDEQIISVKRI